MDRFGWLGILTGVSQSRLYYSMLLVGEVVGYMDDAEGPWEFVVIFRPCKYGFVVLAENPSVVLSGIVLLVVYFLSDDEGNSLTGDKASLPWCLDFWVCMHM